MPDRPDQSPSTTSLTDASLEAGGDVITPPTVLDGIRGDDLRARSANRDDLVTEHLWLVDRLAANAARRYPAHVDRQELWSAGVLGLVEASRRYDPGEGVPFASYASSRVRGEIIDEVRSRDMASRRLRRVLRVVVRAAEFLSQHLGRAPTVEEIANATGMPLEMVQQSLDDLAAITDLSSIDDPSSGTGNALVDGAGDPGDQLAEVELVGTLRDAVERLPEPLRTIVMRSYWKGDRLQDIASDMGVTFQRVAQYRNEALTALNAWFAQLYDEVIDPGEGPGAARRAAYCATMAMRSTWRARIDAARVPAASMDPEPTGVGDR